MSNMTILEFAAEVERLRALCESPKAFIVADITNANLGICLSTWPNECTMSGNPPQKFCYGKTPEEAIAVAEAFIIETVAARPRVMTAQDLGV